MPMEGKTLPQMAGVQTQENTHEIETNMATCFLSQGLILCCLYYPLSK